jgi:uncharacterized protein YcbX
MDTMPTVASLHVYPVKGTRALDLTSAVLQPWGLRDDRRWMLVDGDGRFLTQRQDPRLGLFRALPQPDGSLVVSHPERSAELHVTAPSADRGDPLVPVQVWASSFKAAEAAAEAHAWFSELLGAELRLVRHDDPERRQADPEYAGPGVPVSLADGFPLLVTTLDSLRRLNELIAADHPGDPVRGAALPMARFRPNLVLDGTGAWAEDDWHRIRVGGVVFRVVKPCGRCVVTTIDPATAERRGPEPLKALARHHRFADKLVFGQNLVPEPPDGTGVDPAAGLATLRVGDQVEILD